MKDSGVVFNRLYFGLITVALTKRHFRVRLTESCAFELEWNEQVSLLMKYP